jgi:hypothetical protein
MSTISDVWFFDTETHLIQEGQQAPPIVCLQAGYGQHFKSIDVEVSTGTSISSKFREMIASGRPIFAFNSAFDLTVMMAHDPSLIGLIFEALDRGQILCLMLAERLIHNAEGTLNATGRIKLAHDTVGPFSLAACVWRRLSIDVSEGKSESSWRLRYKELDGVNLSEWPTDAVAYAQNDVFVTKELYFNLLNSNETPFPDLPDLPARTRAALSLRLMECWGLVTDSVQVSILESSASSLISAASERMINAGLMRSDGTLDLEALRLRVEANLGKSTPKTEKGFIKTDRQTLASCDDEVLKDWSGAGFARKVLNTFVPIVKRGIFGPVHARYQSMVETGRTSCSNPPLQQIPRSVGDLGVRECFVPRPGKAYVAADYDAIEMRTFAQVLLDQIGHSKLAEGFIKNPRFDPHTHLAKSMNKNWRYLSDKQRKNARQRAKLANFGYAGGLGISTFLRYAAGFGLSLTNRDAQSLKSGWFQAYPEVREYFHKISHDLSLNRGSSSVVHARSLRVRGNCTFTQCANTPFQGMTADGALHSLFLSCREMYDDHSSPLWGCRPAIFIHDEIIIECDIGKVHEAGMRLAKVMEIGMQHYVPDIPITVEPVAMSRWSKDACATHDEESGRLSIWTPQTTN